MTKVRVTITIDKEDNDELRKLSKEDHRSFSQMVNMILKEYLEKKESK